MRKMTDSPTVFVVDDDPSMRKSLRRLVESAGLRVETFAGAREFLARFEARPNTCLVLDVRMPDMNGLALQRELVKRRASIPIIMMSGYATAKMAAEARKGGAFGFVEKPFEDEQLLDCIQQALAMDVKKGPNAK
jgi:FixJ family two-component response regulator